MLTFQVETWADIWRDGQEIFKIHYDELALHKDEMPMGLDNDFYTDLQNRNFLLVVTARRDGKLIGYYVGIVIAHHPHNKDAGKVATCDMFYLLPKQRKGGAGAKLLMAAENALRENGVVKATISTKANFESGPLLDALGWEKTDIVRQKIITRKQAKN
jgi:GNAT superfamily N-acetyltransferase